jgi:hypothetical protein
MHFQAPIPKRRTVTIIIFAALAFFGPLWILAFYGSPTPTRVLDAVAWWYVIGSVVLMTALIGPARPDKD